jgi:hypothetical protein
VQPGATEQTAGAVVLGDEAAEEPVEVLHRLDQAERAAMPVVDGDVLETRFLGEVRGGTQHGGLDRCGDDKSRVRKSGNK